MRIGVSDHGTGWVSTQTDANGQFDIGVSAGTWYLQLETNEAQERSLVGPDLPAFNVVDGRDQNGILVTARTVTAKINGSVKSNNGSSIEGLGVSGVTTVNGTKYSDWIRTDSMGNFHLRTFNGTWQLSLDCYGLELLGYGCPGTPQVVVNGSDATFNFVVASANPLKIDSSVLANGRVGTAYRLQLLASGGQPPYQWALTSGSASLPPGLSLSSDGFLSGTPTASGLFNFILTAQDGARTSVSQTFGITISGQAALSLPARLSSTQFRMNLNGDVGQNYTLQYSETLTSWNTLLITNAPGTSFSITDQNATNAWRFYRILVGP